LHINFIFWARGVATGKNKNSPAWWRRRKKKPIFVAKKMMLFIDDKEAPAE